MDSRETSYENGPDDRVAARVTKPHRSAVTILLVATSLVATLFPARRAPKAAPNRGPQISVKRQNGLASLEDLPDGRALLLGWPDVLLTLVVVATVVSH